jgi:integrase/recombinase XerD
MSQSIPQVSLYIRFTEGKKRRYERINRKRPQTGGIYCLHYYENGRRTWKAIGTDLNAASAARLAKESELLAGPTAPAQDASLLETAIEKYLANITKLKSEKTADGYRYTLEQFKQSCKKAKVREVSRQDLMDFVIYLKVEELGDRTISNRVGEVVTFLRANGIKDVTYRHNYTEKIVSAYHPDDVKLLLCASSPEEWLIFSFFLITGCREQEVMHASWGDVDFKRKLFIVRDHPEWGFTTKDHEERPIPLTDGLLEKLSQRVRNGELIFPTKDGKPNGHFLRALKAIAERAGVDPTECNLHKWRKTYATLQHENGVSARTLQKRLGHSSLETTLAYLEAAEVTSEESRAVVNDTFAVFA